MDDNVVQNKDCVDLINLIQEGKIAAYTSGFVIAEMNFVLTKLYKFPKNLVLRAIKKILRIRKLTIREHLNTRTAIEIYEKYNIKFGDCIIITQIPKDCLFVTYDTEFKKVKNLNCITPREAISN